MAGFTDALEQAILNHVMGKATYTADANHFVALSTTTPTEAAGNFTEPAGGAYARVSTAAADWNSASGTAPAILDNLNTITFPQATASWGTVTHFGIYSASTAGTLRCWGALAASKAIDNGDTASFAAGALDLKLGDPSDIYT